MSEFHDVPASEDAEGEQIITPEAAEQWSLYLERWERQVYEPLFAPRGISRETALTCWFVNRLRNALGDGHDDDAGNEPWKG